jgi:hypothetical protein
MSIGLVQKHTRTRHGSSTSFQYNQRTRSDYNYLRTSIDISMGSMDIPVLVSIFGKNGPKYNPTRDCVDKLVVGGMVNLEPYVWSY